MKEGYTIPTKLDWTLLGAISLYLLLAPDQKPPVKPEIAPIPPPVLTFRIRPIPTITPALEAVRTSCKDIGVNGYFTGQRKCLVTGDKHQ